jgi:hypothetical protein
MIATYAFVAIGVLFLILAFAISVMYFAVLNELKTCFDDLETDDEEW